MADLAPCEQCPVRLRFEADERAALTEDTRNLVPIVGQAAVEGIISAEEEVNQRIVAGSADCPGFKPMSRVLRSAVRFFDGQAGLDFADNIRCKNPVYNDPEFRKQIDERRNAFEQLVKSRTPR